MAVVSVIVRCRGDAAESSSALRAEAGHAGRQELPSPEAGHPYQKETPAAATKVDMAGAFLSTSPPVNMEDSLPGSWQEAAPEVKDATGADENQNPARRSSISMGHAEVGTACVVERSIRESLPRAAMSPVQAAAEDDAGAMDTSESPAAPAVEAPERGGDELVYAMREATPPGDGGHAPMEDDSLAVSPNATEVTLPQLDGAASTPRMFGGTQPVCYETDGSFALVHRD